LTDVELNIKEWKRVMEWLSLLFKEKSPTPEDLKLYRKIEIIYETEVEFEESFKDL